MFNLIIIHMILIFFIVIFYLVTRYLSKVDCELFMIVSIGVKQRFL